MLRCKSDRKDNYLRDSTFQVFGLGQCSIDYLGIVERYPPADAKCEFTEMIIQGGGPVATAMVALSRWGVKCTFTGVVGSDSFGDEIIESLIEEGVDTSGLHVREDCSSQFAFIAVEPWSGRRTIFWQRPSGAVPHPDEIDYNQIRNTDVLYTDGLFIDATMEACREARKSGTKVVVDAGTLREGMLELAGLCDFFIASRTFAKAFTGEGNEIEACRKIADLGPEVVGITLGEEGYVAIVGGEITKRPAYEVEAVDTTGCGDTFHAGFTFGLINGWDKLKCLDFGAWAASRVSLKLGGRTGIPDVKEYNELKIES